MSIFWLQLKSGKVFPNFIPIFQHWLLGYYKSLSGDQVSYFKLTEISSTIIIPFHSLLMCNHPHICQILILIKQILPNRHSFSIFLLASPGKRIVGSLISTEIRASAPYTREKYIYPVLDFAMVWNAHSTLSKSSGHLPFASLTSFWGFELSPCLLTLLVHYRSDDTKLT